MSDSHPAQYDSDIIAKKETEEISWVICLGSKEKEMADLQDRKNGFFFLSAFLFVMKTCFKGKGYM